MEFKGIKSNFYILFLSFCSCLFLSGEDFDISEYPLVIKEHTPWNLEGAEARIEAHRKGDFSVVLALPNGDAIPEGAEYRLRQVNHEFLFGGSLAADWSVPEKEWYPQFKEYFAQLFNYATVNFYWASHEKVRGQWDYDSAPLSSDIYQWARDQGFVLLLGKCPLEFE
jgi:hypothetical protein